MSSAAHPPRWHPPYRSTATRAPALAEVPIEPTASELTGPSSFPGVDLAEADLTTGHPGEPIGERIVVTGRVTAAEGEPLAGVLVEVWQANAAGRYAHPGDEHPAPLDPNFSGAGRCVTDEEGRYRFVTVKPGAYPWRNHDNAWRPAHIHFSVLGRSLGSRLVTQMYFPGDPLLDLDPIFGAVPEPARPRLVASFSLDETRPEWALGYVFDIVVAGPGATPRQP